MRAARSEDVSLGNRASDNNRYTKIIDDIKIVAFQWTSHISTHSAVNVQTEKLDQNWSEYKSFIIHKKSQNMIIGPSVKTAVKKVEIIEYKFEIMKY